VQSQVGDDKAKRLSQHLESMLLLYKRKFPPDKQIDVFPVKLLKNRGAYMDYGGSPGSAAYYSHREKELVAYDTGKWSDDPEPEPGENPLTGEPSNLAELKAKLEDEIKKRQARYQMDILGVIAHEAWHQYFHHHIVSPVEFPSWLDEGLGDYFYTARPVRRNGRLVSAELGGVNEVRLPVIQQAIKNDKATPFEAIIGYRQPEFSANAGVNYAQGWSMCHFLLEHESARYRRVIPELIRQFKISGKMDKCTEKAFYGLDLAEVEKEWKAHVLALKGDEE
jgi:hypothetical protein